MFLFVLKCIYFILIYVMNNYSPIQQSLQSINNEIQFKNIKVTSKFKDNISILFENSNFSTFSEKLICRTKKSS